MIPVEFVTEVSSTYSKNIGVFLFCIDVGSIYVKQTVIIVSTCRDTAGSIKVNILTCSILTAFVSICLQLVYFFFQAGNNYVLLKAFP